MKKLITILVLLLSTQMFSQLGEGSLAIDSRLEPYVEEFIEEGLERGFHLRGFLIKKVDFILVVESFSKVHLGEKIGGISPDRRSLYISSKILKDSVLTRVTLFHELGHIIKNTDLHSCYNCDDIMAEFAPEDLILYRDEEFWDKIVDAYFKFLNN